MKRMIVMIGDLDLENAWLLDENLATVPMESGCELLVGRSSLTGMLVDKEREYLVEEGMLSWEDIEDEVVLDANLHNRIFAYLEGYYHG